MDNNNLNTTSNDISFLDDDANSGFKFKDFIFLVLRNLHWFILCAAICGMYAYYKVRNQERIYASAASIMIKTTASSGSESLRGSTAISAITGQGVAISSVQNEMMVLKSQTNMENMVRQLNLNTMYSYKTKVAKRNKDLYKTSPVEVAFPGMEEETGVSFTVRPLDNNYVMLEDINDSVEQAVKLAKLAKEADAKINLIPYNKANGAFTRPSPETIKRFENALKAARAKVTVRVEKGFDSTAACGQLRASARSKEKKA